MTQIDKSKPVMVTGATGYVAGWLVKRLLDEGFTVHAAVRDPGNEKKIAHLNEVAESSPGSIRYFKSDLLVDGSYAEAMKGCELVFHTASPFTIEVENPQKELIEPAVHGTENVLNSARKTPSVKRVVVTSSCAAIYTDAIECKDGPNGMLTEEVWNTTASIDYHPYSLSKTLAEKKAWEISDKQDQWDLVTINPCMVLGPPLNPHGNTSESISLLKQFADGSTRMGVPKAAIGVVDVRDVADAHYSAGFTPQAKGRYITCAHSSNFLELGQTLLPRYGGKYPLPKNAIPKWLVMIVGPLINKALTRRFIRNNVDVEFMADNSKIRNELGIEFRPLQETMEESFQSLIDEGVIG